MLSKIGPQDDAEKRSKTGILQNGQNRKKSGPIVLDCRHFCATAKPVRTGQQPATPADLNSSVRISTESAKLQRHAHNSPIRHTSLRCVPMPDNTDQNDIMTALNKAPRQRSGWRWPLAIVLLTSAGTVLGNRLADSRTGEVIAIFYGIGLTIVGLSGWWLFFSGGTRTRRWLVFGGILLGSAVAGIAAVREVWFEGDMRPHVRFHWDPPSPADLAQQWLSRNAPPNPLTPQTPEVLANNSAGFAITETQLSISEDDWARYCGPDSRRQISGAKPRTDWTQQPPKLLWRHPVGEAWSSVSIAGHLLWTQEQREALECTVCYNADTGAELWRREDSARYQTSQGGVGPRSTPTVTEAAVYALGATGILNALHPTSGKLLWQRNICTDAGSEMVEWGMSGAPLVWQNMVIVDAGGQNGKAVIAYDRSSGDIVWASGSHKAGYAAPRIETIDGRPVLLVFHGDGLEALNPEDGQSFWLYPWVNQYRINVAQPMLFGNRVFLSSGYDSGCVLLDPARLTDMPGGVPRPAEVWSPTRSLKLKFNEAVQLGDFVYGLDDGILACVDVNTGERRWKGGRYKYGHVLLWQDLLLVQAEDGFVALVQADPTRFQELTRFPALTDRTWNVPAVHRGRLYVRNASELACFQFP